MFRRRNSISTKPSCPVCGKVHTEWPALAFTSPANYHFLSNEDKTNIGMLNSDFCVIHGENQVDRFVRATLIQKVNDYCDNLHYGLWVSLSEKSYNDYESNFNNTAHETKYFGWLCNEIPGYSSTLAIPCDVVTKTGNTRPEIIPHGDFNHPFVLDYQEGISMLEAERRIEEMLGMLG